MTGRGPAGLTGLLLCGALFACGGAPRPAPVTAAPAPVTAPPPGPAGAPGAAPGAVTAAAPDPGQPVRVDLQVEAITKGGQRVISSGETLHSGDKMALRLEVDQPAYVYVAQAAADGSSTLIFPRAGDEQLKPGGPVRVPPVGQWFKLDKDTGQENLFVYAARQPIPEAALQARIKSDAETVKAAAKPQPKAAARPRRQGGGGNPAGLTAATRGLELDESGPAPQVDKTGISTIRFSIQHAR